MPVFLIYAPPWTEPYVGGDVVVSSATSNITGSLGVGNALGTAEAWAIGARPPNVQLTFGAATLSQTYFVTATVSDTTGANIGAATAQLVSAADITLVVPLTFSSSDAARIMIEVKDAVGNLTDDIATLRNIVLGVNTFWTSLDGCVELTG